MNYDVKRAALIEYLKVKTAEGDWHGVSDAANDLRVLEAQQSRAWFNTDRPGPPAYVAGAYKMDNRESPLHEPRCNSREFNGHRCLLLAGHTGDHKCLKGHFVKGRCQHRETFVDSLAAHRPARQCSKSEDHTCDHSFYD